MSFQISEFKGGVCVCVRNYPDLWAFWHPFARVPIIFTVFFHTRKEQNITKTSACLQVHFWFVWDMAKYRQQTRLSNDKILLLLPSLFLDRMKKHVHEEKTMQSTSYVLTNINAFVWESIRLTLHDIIRKNSTSQSLKGFFSAGPVKSYMYIQDKLSKRWHLFVIFAFVNEYYHLSFKQLKWVHNLMDFSKDQRYVSRSLLIHFIPPK